MMTQRIPSYITEINDVSQLNDEDKTLLADVIRQHAFRVSDYYLNLINWTDPHDPIRRIVFPEKTELLEWGNLDASYEDYYTVLPGLEHKYRDTTLLLITDMCAGFCRYCFRKRLFMPENGGAKIDVPKCVRYITEHKEVNNVILSGGPLYRNKYFGLNPNLISLEPIGYMIGHYLTEARNALYCVAEDRHQAITIFETVTSEYIESIKKYLAMKVK